MVWNTEENKWKKNSISSIKERRSHLLKKNTSVYLTPSTGQHREIFFTYLWKSQHGPEPSKEQMSHGVATPTLGVTSRWFCSLLSQVTEEILSPLGRRVLQDMKRGAGPMCPSSPLRGLGDVRCLPASLWVTLACPSVPGAWTPRTHGDPFPEGFLYQ